MKLIDRSRIRILAGALALVVALAAASAVGLGPTNLRASAGLSTGPVIDQILDDPAAIHFQDSTHMFGRYAPDSELWHRTGIFDFSTKETMGGTMTFGPGVASWGPNRLDVFYRGTNGALYQMYYDGQWHGHYKLTADNVIQSHVTAVSWGPNRIDVFARGTSGGIVQVYWDGASWHQNNSIPLASGAPMYHGLGVSSRGAGKLDLFYRGTDNALYHTVYDSAWAGIGDAWRAWERVGPTGALTSDPRSASWNANRIDVFARGQGNALIHYAWDNGVWRTLAENLGGSLGSGPAVVSPMDGALEIVARRSGDGALVYRSFNFWNLPGWSDWLTVPVDINYFPTGNCCAG